MLRRLIAGCLIASILPLVPAVAQNDRSGPLLVPPSSDDYGYRSNGSVPQGLSRRPRRDIAVPDVLKNAPPPDQAGYRDRRFDSRYDSDYRRVRILPFDLNRHGQIQFGHRDSQGHIAPPGRQHRTAKPPRRLQPGPRSEADLIAGWYRTYFGREIAPGELRKWLSDREKGMPLSEIFASVLASKEWIERSGGTPRRWIASTLAVLGQSDPAAVDAWTQRFHNRGGDRLALTKDMVQRLGIPRRDAPRGAIGHHTHYHGDDHDRAERRRQQRQQSQLRQQRQLRQQQKQRQQRQLRQKQQQRQQLRQLQQRQLHQRLQQRRQHHRHHDHDDDDHDHDHDDDD